MGVGVTYVLGGATLRGERARASGGWICAGGRLGVLYVLGGALSRERASAGGVDMCLGGALIGMVLEGVVGFQIRPTLLA